MLASLGIKSRHQGGNCHIGHRLSALQTSRWGGS